MLVYEFIDPKEQIGTIDFAFIEKFLQATRRTQIGWHYITDIVWIYSRVKRWPRDLTIVDAGGGGGPLQFLLAEMGFNVVNIDVSLAKVPDWSRLRYSTRLRQLASYQPAEYEAHLARQSRGFRQCLRDAITDAAIYRRWDARRKNRWANQWRLQEGFHDNTIGAIEWVRGNLCNIPEIEDNSFDALVSLSAIEHLPKARMREALDEIKRILKPAARWAITTSGTERAETWFHEPSQGYCFSVKELESTFHAHSIRDQNPALVLEQYRRCVYLKEHLADFYRLSGKYGMPWGYWDPKYIPVGLSRDA